jgi:hypothetical protein
MSASTIGGIIAVSLFILCYVGYGIWKSGRQMTRLQKMAELFNEDFERYIYKSPGWKVSHSPQKGWYKLIDGNGNPYYIQFIGPTPFQTAVDLLIKGYIYKINKDV